MNPQRFVNDVVKPWDELNVLLSQRYAFQPDLSDVTRLAGTLAVAIKHQADLAGYADRSATRCPSARCSSTTLAGASGSSETASSSNMRRSVSMTSCTRPLRQSGIG